VLQVKIESGLKQIKHLTEEKNKKKTMEKLTAFKKREFEKETCATTHHRG